jgi:hypothetical protein
VAATAADGAGKTEGAKSHVGSAQGSTATGISCSGGFFFVFNPSCQATSTHTDIKDFNEPLEKL